jgi:bacillithiol system protein YtxJ
MGILGNLFGSSQKEGTDFNWIPLINEHQLDEIIAQSHKKTQVIFKHSTRCIISRTALKNFEATYNQNLEIDLYYLDLLNYREISNEIVDRFNILHESPQLLVIKNGTCVYNESHEFIEASQLENY